MISYCSIFHREYVGKIYIFFWVFLTKLLPLLSLVNNGNNFLCVKTKKITLLHRWMKYMLEPPVEKGHTLSTTVTRSKEMQYIYKEMSAGEKFTKNETRQQNRDKSMICRDKLQYYPWNKKYSEYEKKMLVIWGDVTGVGAFICKKKFKKYWNNKVQEFFFQKQFLFTNLKFLWQIRVKINIFFTQNAQKKA